MVFNSGWLFQLSLADCDGLTRYAFLQTLGHELGHADSEFCAYEFGKHKYEFAKKTNEVHADFCGWQFFEYDQLLIIRCMQFKLDAKGSDPDSCDHPTWKKRIEYISAGKFDEALIRRIAADCGCTDEVFIRKVCDHCEGREITLNNGLAKEKEKS